MIKELTQKQIDAIPKYVDSWVKIGLTTKPMSESDASIDFGLFQTKILERKTPAPVVLFDSPLECWIAVNLIKNDANIKSSEIHKKVANQLSGKDKKIKLADFVYPYYDCQFWASFFAYYDFFKNECGIELNDNYEILKKTVMYGMVFPLNELCIVCQPPTIIKKNANGLHCENGPALSYNGHNEIYALNGVIMKKEHVMTPASKIKGSDIMAETNVEVRRELIRKVGIERLLETTSHKVLDKKDNYELLSLDLTDELKNCKYLKMINPSVGCYHVEGVDPSINTVDAALKWRNDNMFESAEILT